MEVDQRFESPLRNLGLVGGVRGVPAGVFQHVALDDRGSVGVVVTQTQHAVADGVVAGKLREFGENVRFARGSGNRGGGVGLSQMRRHRLIHELVEAG